MDLLNVLVGFMTGAFIFSLALDGVLVWQAYERWKVLRKDIVALNEKIDITAKALQAYQEEQGLRRAMALDDAGVAQIERRNHMRKVIQNMSLEDN